MEIKSSGDINKLFFLQNIASMIVVVVVIVIVIVVVVVVWYSTFL